MAMMLYRKVDRRLVPAALATVRYLKENPRYAVHSDIMILDIPRNSADKAIADTT